jgi:hypothetical protein
MWTSCSTNSAGGLLPALAIQWGTSPGDRHRQVHLPFPGHSGRRSRGSCYGTGQSGPGRRGQARVLGTARVTILPEGRLLFDEERVRLTPL